MNDRDAIELNQLTGRLVMAGIRTRHGYFVDMPDEYLVTFIYPLHNDGRVAAEKTTIHFKDKKARGKWWGEFERACERIKEEA